jgi:leukotriene-A4 hydrolase
MKNHLRLLALSSVILGLASCDAPDTTTQVDDSKSEQYVKDVHSFAQPDKIAVSHIGLELLADFDTKTLSGTVTHTLMHNAPATEVHFDVSGLRIDAAYNELGDSLKFEVKKGNNFGDDLVVNVTAETQKVKIVYATTPESKAVQWLEPVQTLGKKQPFLFTQGQAILTRTWIPSQDSPGIRVTYDAKITVPKDLMAVMSASNPTEKSADGVYSFEMKQRIPPYLIALSIGDLAFQSLGDRTGVYAEPEMLPKAAYELAEMESMVKAAENLYGPYAWERYDVIVLPPSFPFGGMENPRLTFATPTIIAGDRSLTSLIAHELAHSWSGNLVTNATWDDFWLNEGFTVYFEYRIMEAVYGKEYAVMLKSLGLQGLKHTVEELGPTSADTHLKLNLEGRDPDEGMTDIAYEKGHMFLEMLEETYGRDTTDVFLKGYFNQFAFQNMTTERFLTYLDKELISKHDKKVNVDEWVFGPGLPANCKSFTSDRFAAVDAQMRAWLKKEKKSSEIFTAEWSTHEWLHFLRSIPEDLTADRMADLDKSFSLTASTNAEIQGIWYEKAVLNGYEKAFPAMENFLINVGRRKFLTPLYTAMIKDGRYTDKAKAIYAKARPNYHSVSTGTMDALLDN